MLADTVWLQMLALSECQTTQSELIPALTELIAPAATLLLEIFNIEDHSEQTQRFTAE